MRGHCKAPGGSEFQSWGAERLEALHREVEEGGRGGGSAEEIRKVEVLNGLKCLKKNFYS